MEKSKPYIILSAAITLDGKIATKCGDAKISSHKDKIRLHNLRTTVDGILIGINTVKQDDPLLTIRYAKCGHKHPVRIILDSNGIIDHNTKILKTSTKFKTIIVVSEKIPQRNLNRLKNYLNVDIIMSGKKTVDIKQLLRHLLTKYSMQRILVEGGSKVNWSFINQNLFDELIITVSPYLVGGKRSIPFLSGIGFPNIADSPTLKLKSITRLEDEVVLNYVRPCHF